jgi:hypothetical protein
LGKEAIRLKVRTLAELLFLPENRIRKSRKDPEMGKVESQMLGTKVK